MSLRRTLVGLTSMLVALPAVSSAAQERCVDPVPADTVPLGGARADRVLASLGPRTVARGEPTGQWSLTDRLVHHHVPGISIAVIANGRLAWARGVGLANPALEQPVTADTRFQAASVSKPISATVMLAQVRAGRVALDTDVQRYLTRWKLPASPFTAHEAVTLRRLASHTAGLGVSGFRGYPVGAAVPTTVQLLDGQPPANNPPVRVDTVPGARWAYSGGGTMVLQLALEDATGLDFATLAERTVLRPLGMQHSAYAQPIAPAWACAAAVAHNGEGAPVPGGWHVYPELAPAGLWTTATDVARWAIAVGAAWRGTSTTVLDRPLARAMLTPVQRNVGLGPIIEGRGESLHFQHDGANEGYRSKVVLYPARGLGAVVLTNSDAGMAVIDEVLRAIAVEYAWPDFGPTQVATASLTAAELAGMAGTYLPTTGRPMPAELVVRDGRVYFRAPGLADERLLLTSATRAVTSTLGWTFEFTRDSGARVTALAVIRDDGVRIEARRAP